MIDPFRKGPENSRGIGRNIDVYVRDLSASVTGHMLSLTCFRKECHPARLAALLPWRHAVDVTGVNSTHRPIICSADGLDFKASLIN